MTAIRRIRRLGDAKGTNLVEAAIVMPLLLLLTFAIVDFAMLFYAYLALESGVSQATRYAVTGNSQPGMTRQQSIIAEMRRAAPTLTIPDAAFSFRHMPQGSANWVAGPGGPSAIENVQVAYTWSALTPVMRPFFPNGQLTLRVSSTMKNEGRFQ
jgi:Flp pilus assembly protein TadG